MFLCFHSVVKRSEVQQRTPLLNIPCNKQQSDITAQQHHVQVRITSGTAAPLPSNPRTIAPQMHLVPPTDVFSDVQIGNGLDRQAARGKGKHKCKHPHDVGLSTLDLPQLSCALRASTRCGCKQNFSNKKMKVGSLYVCVFVHSDG